MVRVVVPERDGTSYGSGALVAVNESSGLVVTNWHVVRDAAGPIAVVFPDGFRSGAYLLRTDRDWDLAALAIRRPNVPPIAAVEPGAPARRAADHRRLRQRLVPRRDGRLHAIRLARRQPAVRDDRAGGAGAERRLGRTDPQQPRRTGRRAVRLGLRPDHAAAIAAGCAGSSPRPTAISSAFRRRPCWPSNRAASGCRRQRLPPALRRRWLMRHLARLAR